MDFEAIISNFKQFDPVSSIEFEIKFSRLPNFLFLTPILLLKLKYSIKKKDMIKTA